MYCVVQLLLRTEGSGKQSIASIYDT